jgi:hypothetical protein
MDQEAAGQLALGLTPETAGHDIPEQVVRIRDNARIVQARLDELASTPLPGASDYDLPAGPAWPVAAGRDRDAVLQPPKPDIIPSSRILQHHQAAQAHADYEAESG